MKQHIYVNDEFGVSFCPQATEFQGEPIDVAILSPTEVHEYVRCSLRIQ